MKRWQVFLGVVLLLASTLASALSLGRVRGTPLLGRGLDVSIQSSMQAQESVPEAGCFAIELFYGDARVSPNAISVVPERVAADDFRIRIRASTVVDEPVVTLFVRTVCGPGVSRRYVLLAELLTEQDSAVSPPTAAQAIVRQPSGGVTTPATPASSPAPSVSLAPSVPSARLSAPQASASSDSVSARKLTREERAEQRKAQREAKQQASKRTSVITKKTQPRLQLDLLDLSSLEPNLRHSFELTTEPAADPAVRAQALALWRSLNASPEDALRDSQRLETLEAQMRQSLQQSQRQANEIASLSANLQTAQRERYINPFTLFLALLTLAALVLSVWLWRRQAHDDRPWWRGAAFSEKEQQEEQLWNHLNEEMMQDVDVGLATSKSTPESTAARLTTTEPSLGAGQSGSAPTALSNRASKSGNAASSLTSTMPKSGSLGHPSPANRGMARFEETKPPAMPEASRSAKKALLLPDRDMGYSDFANSNFASSRLVSTEELFDIQEQADFFMSLDQPEQAIAVLKNHITDNVETSALAYMDLFDIYHRTDREEDYQQLREEFNRVFNAQVPEFSNYSDQSMGLEEYPQAMAAITHAWPRPQEALALIEEYIFRQPDPQQLPFDMLAYRELMLMYAMTKDLVKTQSAETMLPTIAALKEAISGHASTRAELDISFDLDSLSAALPKSSNTRDVDSARADQLSSSVMAQEPGMDDPEAVKELPALDFDLSHVDMPAADRSSKA